MIIMIIFYFLSEFISARIKYFTILIKNLQNYDTFEDKVEYKISKNIYIYIKIHNKSKHSHT